MTDLGQAIKEFRLGSGQTRSQLAAGALIGPSELSRWERGYAVPTGEEVERLGAALALSRPQIDYLLSEAGYAPEGASIVEPAVLLAQENQDVRELRIQVSDLKNLLEGVLRDRAEQNNDNGAGDEAQLEELALLADEIQLSSQRITAPVILPAMNDLKVHLVPAPQVERLEEYRNESKVWSTAFGISFGLASGLLVNGATGSNLSLEMWMLCGSLIMMSALFLWASHTKASMASSLAGDISERT